MEISKAGEANYNIYASDSSKKNKAAPDTAGTSLRLEKIAIENSHLVYNDQSIPMVIDANKLYCEGSGDLDKF